MLCKCTSTNYVSVFLRQEILWNAQDTKLAWSWQPIFSEVRGRLIGFQFSIFPPPFLFYFLILFHLFDNRLKMTENGEDNYEEDNEVRWKPGKRPRNVSVLGFDANN